MVLNRKGVPGFSGEEKFSLPGVVYPCFPRKMEMEGRGGGGCPRELRARGRYNIQGWGGRVTGRHTALKFTTSGSFLS